MRIFQFVLSIQKYCNRLEYIYKIKFTTIKKVNVISKYVFRINLYAKLQADKVSRKHWI